MGATVTVASRLSATASHRGSVRARWFTLRPLALRASDEQDNEGNEVERESDDVKREEDPPGYVLLGSVANATVSKFPLSPWETEESRQSVRHSFPTASAVAARLDVLARGWRDK
jgi:hypothetical protein